MVDGTTRCIELERDRKSEIYAELHKIVRMTRGVPFKRIENLIGKSDMQQQQSQQEKIDDVNLKNPAGETANSSVEIFISCKAVIPILEKAAEVSCT